MQHLFHRAKVPAFEDDRFSEMPKARKKHAYYFEMDVSIQ